MAGGGMGGRTQEDMRFLCQHQVPEFVNGLVQRLLGNKEKCSKEVLHEVERCLDGLLSPATTPRMVDPSHTLMELFERQVLQKDPPLCGRLCKHKKGSELTTLHPWNRVVFFMGMDGLGGLVSDDLYAALLRLGIPRSQVVEETKTLDYTLVLTPADGPLIFRADWPGLFKMTQQTDPALSKAIAPFESALQTQSFDQLRGEGEQKYFQFGGERMTAQRVKELAEGGKLQAWHVRAYFFSEVGCTELFRGDGFTYNRQGVRGCSEYIMPNTNVASFTCRTIPLAVSVRDDLAPKELLKDFCDWFSGASPLTFDGQSAVPRRLVYRILCTPHPVTLDSSSHIARAHSPWAFVGTGDNLVRMKGLTAVEMMATCGWEQAIIDKYVAEKYTMTILLMFLGEDGLVMPSTWDNILQIFRATYSSDPFDLKVLQVLEALWDAMVAMTFDQLSTMFEAEYGYRIETFNKVVSYGQSGNNVRYPVVNKQALFLLGNRCGPHHVRAFLCHELGLGSWFRGDGKGENSRTGKVDDEYFMPNSTLKTVEGSGAYEVLHETL